MTSPPNEARGKVPLWRRAWRVAVGVTGTIVLAIGIALIVLPGPAFIFIPLGLAILALEFAWARRLLTRMREWLRRSDHT